MNRGCFGFPSSSELDAISAPNVDFISGDPTQLTYTPHLRLRRLARLPSGDVVERISFRTLDANGVEFDLASLRTAIDSNTGNVNGSLEVRAMQDNIENGIVAYFGKGMKLAQALAYPGTGGLNATLLQVNGVNVLGDTEIVSGATHNPVAADNG